MTCPRCTGTCNQGRDCPYRPKRSAPPWVTPLILAVAFLAVVIFLGVM